MEKIKIFKIIKILTAIFSGAMIIGFIIQLSRIFFGNLNPMFSRELVGKYIFQILPVIILWIICVVLGIVFHFLTNEKQKQLVKSTNEAKFKLLDSMLPDDILDLDEYQLLLKQKKKRLIALIISSIIYVICFIMISLYLFNPDHFIYNGDINGQVIDMLINMCPWLVISLITLICYTYYVDFNCTFNRDFTHFYPHGYNFAVVNPRRGRMELIARRRFADTDMNVWTSVGDGEAGVSP